MTLKSVGLMTCLHGYSSRCGLDYTQDTRSYEGMNDRIGGSVGRALVRLTYHTDCVTEMGEIND